MTIVQSQVALMPTRFEHVLGKLIFSGVQSVKYGKLVVSLQSFHQVLCNGINWVIPCAEAIMKPLLDHAQEVIAPYQDSSVGMPDPSFVLQLPDDVYIGSNLYAVQKFFDGPFQFDIYFDSGSVKQKLTCERTFFIMNFIQKVLIDQTQPPYWIRVSRHWLKHTVNALETLCPIHQIIPLKRRNLWKPFPKQ
jgi:hypothetical protein